MGEKPSKKAEKPAPQCKAMLLCQNVIVDAVTGTPTLVNVFNGFTVGSGFPFKPQPFFVFLQLTGGVGQYDLVVEIHDLSRGKRLGRGTAQRLKFKDRVSIMQHRLLMSGLRFHFPGVYDFVATANDEEIERQRVTVTAKSKK